MFLTRQTGKERKMETAGEVIRAGDEVALKTAAPRPAAANGPDRFRVTLVVVPPGGGEAEYSLVVEVPALPREGDYVTVMRRRDGPVAGEHIGTEDFIVRRIAWAFDHADDGRLYEEADDRSVGTLNGIGIECEPARGHHSSEAHLRACGPRARSFEPSGY